MVFILLISWRTVKEDSDDEKGEDIVQEDEENIRAN